MQVNSVQNNTPNFGAINLYGGASDAIRRGLKPTDWAEFKVLSNSQSKNPVDINLFGKSSSSNKLLAKIIPSTEFSAVKEYSQRLFESQIGFIKRLCEKADNLNIKEAPLRVINPDEILNGLKNI